MKKLLIATICLLLVFPSLSLGISWDTYLLSIITNLQQQIIDLQNKKIQSSIFSQTPWKYNTSPTFYNYSSSTQSNLGQFITSKPDFDPRAGSEGDASDGDSAKEKAIYYIDGSAIVLHNDLVNLKNDTCVNKTVILGADCKKDSDCGGYQNNDNPTECSWYCGFYDGDNINDCVLADSGQMGRENQKNDNNFSPYSPINSLYTPYFGYAYPNYLLSPLDFATQTPSLYYTP